MFQLSQIQVSDDDIAKVEKHFGFSFNDKQKKVIRFWESKGIQACPGSGKTTTLAAKLMILAEKLPKSFYQGICIITHTNTAVNEIKKKLGPYANFYNNYPHHFGTIQSFVDKYLAIPAYKLEYKESPQINDDLVDNLFRRCISLFFKENNNHKSIYQLEHKKILKFNDLIYSENFEISKYIFGEVLNLTESQLQSVNSRLTTIQVYNQFKKIKEWIYSKGYIKFDEAYSLAFKYLREKPHLKNLFFKRFPLVFVDEMQDMETYQYKLIQDLFGGTSAIVQKIGDINQSIFTSNFSQEKSDWQPDSSLELTETTRLSHNLAEIVKPICLKPQLEMKGWQNDNPIPPTIIVFDDNTKEMVKEKFVELIIKYDLLKLWSEDKPFKAIGQRMSQVDDNSLNIGSYWSDFNKNTFSIKRDEFDNLISYLDKYERLTTSKNVKQLRTIMLNAICKALTLNDIKRILLKKVKEGDKYVEKEYKISYTPTTLVDYLKNLDELKLRELNLSLSKWILGFQKTPEIIVKISIYIKSLIILFGQQPNLKLNTFLADTNSLFNQNQSEPKQIYEYQGIKVHFDTIHGAKGETHTATLYLETYLKQVYDIGGKILPFIVKPKRPDNACIKRLPFAYVSMSRATHFLCLSVHKDRFKDYMKDYFEDESNGWKVQSIY